MRVGNDELPERPGKTLMGSLLSTVRFERAEARRKAISELYARNGLENPVTRNGYKVAETSTLSRDGTEITEYRLYKLIDSQVTRVSTTVDVENKQGRYDDQRGEITE